VFDQYARLKPQAPAFTPTLLPNAKYAVMRTGWGAGARFFFFDCAPWARRALCKNWQGFSRQRRRQHLPR